MTTPTTSGATSASASVSPVAGSAPTRPGAPRPDTTTAGASASLGFFRGLWIVTRLELAQRIRSRKLYVALAIWFLVIGAVTLLMLAAFERSRSQGVAAASFGPAAFGIITLFVLGLSLLVTPTFTALSINGDRDAGTLAILQATRLTAVQIAGGKLLAAWLLALGFLIAALPWIIVTTVMGGISPLQVVVCFLVMFVEVAIVCAIGLGWSALIGRPAGSTVMTYASVALLSAILPIALGFASVLTLRDDTVRIWSYAGDPSSLTAQANDWAASGFAPSKRPDWSACHPENQVISRPHVESIWWLIAPNPFVIVADAAPLPPEARGNLETWAGRSGDPLAFLSLLTRSLSLPPSNDQDQCSWALMSDNPASRNYEVRSTSDGGAVVVDARGNVLDTGSPVPRRIITANTPIWPWGLGFSLLLGAGMFYVAVRRLSVPYGVLPKGTRVA